MVILTVITVTAAQSLLMANVFMFVHSLIVQVNVLMATKAGLVMVPVMEQIWPMA